MKKQFLLTQINELRDAIRNLAEVGNERVFNANRNFKEVEDEIRKLKSRIDSDKPVELKAEQAKEECANIQLSLHAERTFVRLEKVTADMILCKLSHNNSALDKALENAKRSIDWFERYKILVGVK